MKFLFAPATVFAHVLETDGNIGGVIHLNPEDDPVAEQETSIFIDLKDKTHALRLDQCSCTYTILRSGEQLKSGTISQQDPSDMTVHLAYTFPEKNIYTIQLSGSPTTENAFQTFTLEYSIRVDRDVRSETSTEPSQLPIITAFLLGIGVSVLFIYSKKKKKL